MLNPPLHFCIFCSFSKLSGLWEKGGEFHPAGPNVVGPLVNSLTKQKRMEMADEELLLDE